MTMLIRANFSLSILLGLTSSTWAQIVPDAGSIRQQIEPSRTAPLPQTGPSPTPTFPAELRPDTGMVIKVLSFRFAGNSLLTIDQLMPTVAELAGRELGFGDLQRAADAVAAAYRKAGWLVRVYLPEQDVSAGVITLQVVEARFSGVRFEGAPSKRVMASEVEAWFKGQPTGEFLSAHALDRALLLADDLPGLSVAGTLAPGRADGETALVLQTTDEPFIYGDVGMDNQGARSTGSQRLTANMNVNSPGDRGELVSLNLLHTQGSDFARAALTVPGGHNGLRLGVSASSLSYQVIGGPDSIVLLDVRGRSSSLGLDWSYPLVRARPHNLYFSGGLENKGFIGSNKDSQADNKKSFSDYESKSLRLALSGNRFDSWGGGGANSASVQALWGQLTHMQGHSLLDTINRRYNKLSYSLSRQQNLSTDHSLLFTLNGQHAQQVLDSSERFYIGGAATVRAYPTSELGGDRGKVISGEWRWRLNPTWVLSSFADVGQVTSLPVTVSSAKTTSQLRGHGLSLSWQAPLGISTKLTWSRRSGRNPQPTQAQTDGDGTLKHNRFWFSASLPF